MIRYLQNYPGKKAGDGQWQKILSEIPKCDKFIEAMCGSAYISSLVVQTGCSIVINDYDRSVIEGIAIDGDIDVKKFNQDYTAIIRKYDGIPGIVFLFDPPYLKDTRRHKKDYYKHEWDLPQHNRFLKNVQAMKSPVIITHYPCKLYDETLKKWRTVTYNSMTRGGIAKERIYLNFPQPPLLQCYHHVGENFIVRQQIKRKIKRHIARLNNEPPQERAAILSAIMDHFNTKLFQLII